MGSNSRLDTFLNSNSIFTHNVHSSTLAVVTWLITIALPGVTNDTLDAQHQSKFGGCPLSISQLGSATLVTSLRKINQLDRKHMDLR